MTRAALAVAAALFLVAAAAPEFRWSLPAGAAPPPVPADNPMSAAKVALGRRLFYDADLSVDGTMACATCHEQRRGFAEGNRTHAGVHGEPGRRNVPGLANVGWLAGLTWADPRVRTLEAQVAIPLTGVRPIEMGMAEREKELARRLGLDGCYRRLFRAAFPERRGRIDATTVSMALAAFQRTFVSLDAAVDRGESLAAGAAAFARHCAGCHAGRLFTDGGFYRLRPASADDPGLAEITGLAADAGRFRTPSLRNVAVTGPWLHDGSAARLADAIAAHPIALAQAERAALLAYLPALTDEAFLHRPDLGYPDDVCRQIGAAP